MNEPESIDRSVRNSLAALVSPLSVPILIVITLAVSLCKELQLIHQGGPIAIFVWLGLLGLLAGALLAFVAPPVRDPQPWAGTATTPGVLAASRHYLAGSALLLSLGAAWLVHAGDSPTAATVAWVVALALVLLAAAPAGSLTGIAAVPARLHARTLPQAWPALAVVALIIVAAALRLPALDSIPGYIHNDEAANGLQARAIADGQVPSIFANGWAGLPMLGFSWDAAFFKVLGDNLTSLRLSSAVLGIASIAVIALLGKELFSWRAGVIAAALLTFSHVAVHFSRVGHHYIQALFAVILTLYLLVLALRYGSRLAAAGAGILLSVDIQVYYAGRVAYAIVPLTVGYVLLVSDRDLLRSRLTTVGWLILGWMVGIAPIGAVILGDIATFTGRTRDVLVLGGTADARSHVYSVYGTHDAFVILRTQFWRLIQTFNFAGDSSQQYGSPHPMLDPISAALFPGAFAYAVFRARRGGFAICLISLVSVLIIGGVLTVDPPFWPRLILLPPLAALVIAAFIDGIWQSMLRVRRAAIPAGLALLVVLGGGAWGNYRWYFIEFQPYVSQNYASAAAMDIGNYLHTLSDDPAVYGITDGNPYLNHQAIQLLAPAIRVCDILQGIDIRSCGSMPDHDRVFVITPARAALMGNLEAAYPGGTLQVLKTYSGGAKIYIYRVVQ